MLPTAALILVLSTPAVASTPHTEASRDTAAGWRRPVPGAVARPFSYGADPFQAGWHRGADFAAPAGTPVRAACSGVVATARPGLVTLRCGPWRVTHLPLASVSVAEGSSVRAGRVVGAVGTSEGHAGLHLGVRRARDRFAYVDPLPFLAGRPAAPPPAVPPRATRIRRTGPARPTTPPGIGESGPATAPAQAPARVFASPPAAVAALPPAAVAALPPTAVPASPARVFASPPAAVAASPPAPPHSALETGVRVPTPAGPRVLAPWPAWIGLGLLLAGVVGGGARVRVRRHRADVPAPVPSAR